MTRIILAASALVVAGCTGLDPYHRTDVWYPSASNAKNIAAMVARPTDLIAGRGTQGGDTHQAVGAIDRVWLDRAKPLVPTGGGTSAAAGTGAPGGAN